MTQTSNLKSEIAPLAHFSQASMADPTPCDHEDLSAAVSDVEPSTTATAARMLSQKASHGKAKRSYKTVDPVKRQ